jgi:hypothetical protein
VKPSCVRPSGRKGSYKTPACTPSSSERAHRLGKLPYQTSAESWRRFVAWCRYHLLYFKLPNRGQPWRYNLWREQRRQLTLAIKTVLAERFYEAPGDEAMIKVVTLATTSLRRCRHPVGLRELLGAPQAHADLLFKFVEKRIELKRLPGAPVPSWQAMSYRGDRFRAYLERKGRSGSTPSSTNPTKIIAKHEENRLAKPANAASAHPYKDDREPLTAERLCNAMADWFYRTVTMDFAQDVCTLAQLQIRDGLVDQYRKTTVATTFEGLLDELRPAEFSNDVSLTSEYAGWLLGCLLALRQQPPWMYGAIETACVRAKRLEEQARNARWITSTPYGSQLV